MALLHQATASGSNPFPPGQAYSGHGWVNPAGANGKTRRANGGAQSPASTEHSHGLQTALQAVISALSCSSAQGYRPMEGSCIPLVSAGHGGKVCSWKLCRRHQSIVPGYEKDVLGGKRSALTSLCHGVAKYHWEDVRAR